MFSFYFLRRTKMYYKKQRILMCFDKKPYLKQRQMSYKVHLDTVDLDKL